MSSSNSSYKPKVLALSYPEYVPEHYMKDFTSKFSLDVLEHKDRQGVIAEIAERLANGEGPWEAVLVLFGTGPYEPFDGALFGSLVPSCRVIASASAGYNEFDIDWMTRSNIWFCNTRNAVSEATADMTIFLILAVLKDTTRAEKQAREGQWKTGLVPTKDPRGMTLGIIGMGAIGKHVATKAAAFGLKVIYHSRTRLPLAAETLYGASFCSTLEELLSKSDIISIHCPLRESTIGLLGRREFAQMKDGVYIVNTARGGVIDDDALIGALQSGKVTRVGMDVYTEEPIINPYFLSSDKCILQPHLGGLTDVSYKLSQIECLENIKACLTTGVPNSPVNQIYLN